MKCHHGQGNHQKGAASNLRKMWSSKKENRRPITPRHWLRAAGKENFCPADSGGRPVNRFGGVQGRQQEDSIAAAFAVFSARGH